MQVTHIFAAADPVVAAEMNQNFDDVEAALLELDSANLAENAGIRSTQLRDRYYSHDTNKTLFPFTSGANYGSPALFTAPIAAAELTSDDVVLKDGQEGYLVEIQVKVAAFAAGAGGEDLVLAFKKNGATLAGATLAIDAAGTYRARNNDPYNNPFAALRDADELTCEASSSGAAAPSVRGVELSYQTKRELIS